MLDYLSLFNVAPAKIKILTTVDTIDEVVLDDIVLKDYPKVVNEYPVDEDIFIDTAIIHNSYAGALGADFDGKKFLSVPC